MTATVKITHPDGVSMRFSEHLTHFLINRPNKHEWFVLGQWLQALDDDTLEQLTALAEKMVDGTAENMDIPADDLVMTCIAVEAAEKRLPSVTVSPEVIFDRLGALAISTTMETFRRRGWVILQEELRLCDASELVFDVTEEGMRAGEQMRMFMN